MADPAAGEGCPCGRDADFECSVCGVQGYCSDSCQRSDWPRHAPLCAKPAEPSAVAQQQRCSPPPPNQAPPSDAASSRPSPPLPRTSGAAADEEDNDDFLTAIAALHQLATTESRESHERGFGAMPGSGTPAPTTAAGPAALGPRASSSDVFQFRPKPDNRLRSLLAKSLRASSSPPPPARASALPASMDANGRRFVRDDPAGVEDSSPAWTLPGAADDADVAAAAERAAALGQRRSTTIDNRMDDEEEGERGEEEEPVLVAAGNGNGTEPAGASGEWRQEQSPRRAWDGENGDGNVRESADDGQPPAPMPRVIAVGGGSGKGRHKTTSCVTLPLARIPTAAQAVALQVLLLDLAGVDAATIDAGAALATITYHADQTSEDELSALLGQCVQQAASQSAAVASITGNDDNDDDDDDDDDGAYRDAASLRSFEQSLARRKEDNHHRRRRERRDSGSSVSSLSDSGMSSSPATGTGRGGRATRRAEAGEDAGEDSDVDDEIRQLQARMRQLQEKKAAKIAAKQRREALARLQQGQARAQLRQKLMQEQQRHGAEAEEEGGATGMGNRCFFSQHTLHSAANTGDVDALTELLLQGPEGGVDAPDEFGRTALFHAVHHNHTACVELLLQHGASVNHGCADQSTPLHEAAYHGTPQMLGLLVQAGGNLRLRDRLGRSPLHWSTGNPSTECLVWLLRQRGADPNETAADGMTPLMYAASHDRPYHVKKLLGFGGDLEEKDQSGKTAFHWAVQRKGAKALGDILTLGATFYRDHQGRTVAHRVGERGGLPALQTVLQLRPDAVADEDKAGRTPLFWAAACGNDAVARGLLEAGADLAHTDRHGATALHYAETLGMYSCIAVLRGALREQSTNRR